ncbi:uncharacterized protein CEXT_752991 [Caerostris extrusa]|uniref:Uncharacterized protein n=1 Tax=Caerostris extrusa TaxID=172846 RepID=A0AAV4T272_CAEEX|nr:uncharacterized protein CEXT_752991 [Caerostris extrusa]
MASEFLSDEHLFAIDLLSFVLRQHQIPVRRHLPSCELNRLFRPSIGQAILNYMIQNSSSLHRLWTNFFEAGQTDDESLRRLYSELIQQRPHRMFELLMTVLALHCYRGVSSARADDSSQMVRAMEHIAFVTRTWIGRDPRNWRWFESRVESINRRLKIACAA